MQLYPLTLGDKTTFNHYLRRQPHILSSYSFENILIWRTLFELSWIVIYERLCLFFKNNVGCFMGLPPLGGLDPEVIRVCFGIMEDFNHNKEISRIENIEENDLSFFKENNFRIYEKTQEYIVSQKDIATLSGASFRHKRNLYNFFIKNHKWNFRNYESNDKPDVLSLYQDWMRERMSKNLDPIYQTMLTDGLKVFSELLDAFGDLDLCAKVVECDGKIKAFTCGFALNQDIFCINFEIADLSFRGLAQFVFTEFAKTLPQYRQINIMDDSGIENIRQTKLSYRPQRMAVAYTALMNQ